VKKEILLLDVEMLVKSKQKMMMMMMMQLMVVDWKMVFVVASK
jgi:hypothetical protein